MNLGKYKRAHVDLGNSRIKASIDGREYSIPNVTAICGQEPRFYEEGYQFDKNLIVEVDSPAIKDKTLKYIGWAAVSKPNAKPIGYNNQKANSPQTLTMLFSALAYDAVKNFRDKNEKMPGHVVHIELDMLTCALPTTQSKTDRELLKQKLIGNHTVTFHYVPGVTDNKIIVKFMIVDVAVGAEAAMAFLYLSRDPDSLEIREPQLFEQTVMIADIGGDTTDYVVFQEGKPIHDIEGEVFGINSHLDRIMKEVQNGTGHSFKSRYELERILEKDPSEWIVWVDGYEESIKEYVDPILNEMAAVFLDRLDLVRSGNSIASQSQRFFIIGGAAKLAKPYIEATNQKRAELSGKRPLRLTFPRGLENLNLRGLELLAKIALAQKTSAQHA